MFTKKRVFALLMAGLILVSATACSSSGDEDETTTGSGLSVGTGLVPSGNETDTDAETTGTGTSVTPGGSINEDNADVTDKDCTLLVVAETVVNIRKNTSTASDALATVKDGVKLESTGYTENWYRVKYEDEVGYISKRMVVEYDQELVDSFEECTEQVKIVAETSINVRRYPDWSNDKNDLVCGQLLNGQTVTCVAKADGWYKVKVKTDKNGIVDMKDGTETREYYITANPTYVELETAAN